MEATIPISMDTINAPRIVLAGHAKFLPDDRFVREQKSEYEICLISTGLAHVSINDIPFRFEGGCAFSFEPGDVLAGRGDATHGVYSCRWVRFSFQKSQAQATKRKLNLPRSQKLTPAALREFQSAFDMLLESFSAGWDGWELAAGGYMLALLAVLTREAVAGGRPMAGPLDRRLLTSAAFLERNFARNIKIAEVAEHVRMSEGYFVRMFHRRFAVPPLQYLVGLRLKEARRLLLSDPNVTIAEAARRAGFGNSKYFATVFKAHYQIAPSAFRNSVIWRGPG